MDAEFSVCVTGTIDANELSDLQKILLTTKIHWDVTHDSVQQKSFDNFEQALWLIIAYIPFRKFFDTFAEELAKDIYKELKTFFKRLYNNRKKHVKSEGVIFLKDTETGNTYELPMQLEDPDLEIAIEKLLEENL